jgi:hypothetical protein
VSSVFKGRVSKRRFRNYKSKSTLTIYVQKYGQTFIVSDVQFATPSQHKTMLVTCYSKSSKRKIGRLANILDIFKKFKD